MTPPLMLLHGWGFSSTVWRPLMAELHAIGIDHVYPVDLPGFGTAWYEPFGSVSQVLDYLDEQLPPGAVLCGWSLGGMLAMQLIARHRDRYAGFVTLGSNLHFTATDTWPGMPAADFDEFRERFSRQPEKTWQRFLQLQTRGDSASAEAGQRLVALADFAVMEPEAAAKMLDILGGIDNRALYPVLAVPGLHLFGEADAITPVAVVNALQSMNAAKDCEVLSGAGHAMPVSRPAELASRLRSFVEALAV